MAPSASHLHTSLSSRDASTDSGDNSKLTTTLIIGIAVAAVLFAGLCVWLAIRYFRKNSASKREDDRGASFLNVKGVVKEGEKSLAVKGDIFSRDKMSDSIILPEKAILRPNASREEIINHYAAEGKLPRPFAPFMTDEGGLKVPTIEEPENKRNSSASWMSFAMPRHSFLSAKSSRSSVMSFAEDEGDKRKVRQIFTPVLPDELVISLGDRLTVVNSYDDGWCIVGRDSVFKPGEVELGAIPAWCFMKPVQGLRTERPMRTTSLGVTITLGAPAGPRDNVMSWSNF